MRGENIIGAILGLLLLGCLLALAFMGGMLAAGSFSSGADTMIAWTVVAVIVSAVICGGAGFMWGDMESDYPRRWMIGIGLLGAVVTAYPSVDFLVHGHEIAAYQREMAPKAQAYVLEHFDDFDADHSGMIEDSELATAAANLPSADGRAYAQFLRDEQSTAGQVTGSYTSTTYVWISTGNGGGYMSPITTTTYTYGITRRDLEGFTARTNKRFERW